MSNMHEFYKETYNSCMNKTKLQIQNFILIMSLILIDIPSLAFADADPLQKQKDDCLKNTAMEWSNTYNRCVGKVAAREKRNEAISCNKEEDLAKREACHKRLAEKATGLSADTGSLNQGNTDKSMAMNSIATVFGLVALLNGAGSGLTFSVCTSKRIFGITAIAGIASDIYLKMKAKDKDEELKNKFHLDAKSSANNSQVKALEYLKEEQNTVAEIAGMEKTRNMLLMAGYGAAGIMALVEMAYPETNPGCLTPEPEAKPTGSEVATGGKQAVVETVKATATATATATTTAGSMSTGAAIGTGAAVGAGGVLLLKKD